MPRKCQEKGCARWPVYNYPGVNSRIYCSIHVKEGMVAVGQQLCREPECNKYALYNYADRKEKLYCQTHSKPGMVNVKRRICVFDGCPTQAYHNYPGKTVGIYCAEHSLKDMINVYTKTCKKCGKTPSYNYPDIKRAEYCQAHKKEGMINVIATKCQECNRQASFAVPGASKYTHCGVHKSNDMVNVRVKMCRYTGCDKTALFGKKKGAREYCGEHKNIEMTNLQVRLCQECDKYAHYGINKRTHCSEHKTEDMKNFNVSLCQESGCDKTSTFNYRGLGRAFCGTHKKQGMINVNTKYCIKKGCDTTATFGYPGNPPEYCAGHRPEGTKLQPTKRCVVRTCNELALFGRGLPMHCEDHATKEEFNLIERECKHCGLLGVLDKKKLCRYCNPDSWKKIRLAKQKEIEALFKYEKLEFLQTDRRINGGECGAERPDFLFEGTAHYVIVEVDEDQHKSRACECEQTRMVNISQSLGSPTIFIRYNPDLYKVKGIVRDTPKKARHKMLMQWLIDLMTLEPSDLENRGFLSVLHLYFDEYNPRNILWETILDYDH